MSTPPPSERETSPASDRRPSTDSTGTGETKPHRRKQAQPSRPASPPYPALSLRPNSDLFPPVATSTPRRKGDGQPAAAPGLNSTSPSRNSEEKENKGEARPDVLQVRYLNSLLLCSLMQTLDAAFGRPRLWFAASS